MDTELPTVHEVVSRAALRHPDAVAVADHRATVTYAELEDRSDLLMARLRERGAGPGVAVGVLTRRSRRLPSTLLGILKTGALYVPLDPRLPDDRIETMIADAGVELVVTDSSLLGRLRESPGLRLVDLDRDRAAVAARTDAGLHRASASGQLAYVMHTSGSTGRPKGVEVPHRGVVALLASMARMLDVGPGTVWAAGTSCSFDISVVELFLPLTAGGRVFVLADDAGSDGKRLADELTRRRATHFQATPSGWQVLLASGWRAAAPLVGVTGGESVPGDLADRLADAGVGPLWNAYGPTEASIWATMSLVDGRRPIPIGRGVGGATVHVLDDLLRPVPDGDEGELCVGGDAVARGYRGLPGATARAFVPDPFATRPGARLYRTGDRARVLPGGELEFLGRRDTQVKIRGHRVELGEVEAALRACPGVADAAAVLRQAASDAPLLCGYVVLRPETTTDRVRELLVDRLPPPAVPDVLVEVGAMPLTPNGKLDRNALAAAEAGSGTAPISGVERRVAELAEETLATSQPVGRVERLTARGLHSLHAMRLTIRVNQEWRIRLPLQAVLRDPTVAGIAAAVTAEAEAGAGASPLRSPEAPPVEGAIVSRGKLVRDGIPDIIRATGGQPVVRVADDDEYRALLRDKLLEEVDEFLASGEPEELADVLEVLLALAAEHGLTDGALEDLRRDKHRDRGGFDARTVWLGNADG